MGTVYSAYLFSYAIMMIPGGWFTDVAGPRVSLAVMAFGSALFTALTTLGGSPGLGTYIGVVAAFLVIRLAMGVFASPMYPAAGRMSANWNPPHSRARVWGWIASGAGFGGACTPLHVLLDARTLRLARFVLAGRGGQRLVGGGLVLVCARLSARGKPRAAHRSRPLARSLERAAHQSRPDATHRGLRHRELLRVHFLLLALLLFRDDSQNGHGPECHLHDADVDRLDPDDAASAVGRRTGSAPALVCATDGARWWSVVSRSAPFW